MNSQEIRRQRIGIRLFYILFAVITFGLMMYYLSNTIIHPTTPRQFPINSLSRFPLSLLIIPAEIFSFAFALYFVYTLLISRRRIEKKPQMDESLAKKRVAILIPVYHEPKKIIERTIKACKRLDWSGGVTIYLADDSQNEENRQAIEQIAREHGVERVTRPDWRGKKAGNINNAVKNELREDFFVILDCDQAPRPDFLKETMPFFMHSDVGFVQAPQHFVGDKNPIERASKIGTDIFYRVQSLSKSADGAMPFCGTNAVIRTSVFKKVNGFSYYTATEDIDLGIRMNAVGYRGVFVPKVLVDGFAPPDFRAYKIQQYRWANGNLAILRENFLKVFFGNFSLRYSMHMFFTLGWWLIGLVTLLYILVPLVSAIFGLGTHHTWLPTSLLLFLFLHVVIGISLIYVSLFKRVDGERITLKDSFLQYSLITNSLFIYTRAAINALLLGRYASFKRTNKEGTDSGIVDVIPNLALGAVAFIASLFTLYAAIVSGDPNHLRTNVPLSLWLLFYSVILFSSVIFVGKFDGDTDGS